MATTLELNSSFRNKLQVIELPSSTDLTYTTLGALLDHWSCCPQKRGPVPGRSQSSHSSWTTDLSFLWYELSQILMLTTQCSYRLCLLKPPLNIISFILHKSYGFLIGLLDPLLNTSNSFPTMQTNFSLWKVYPSMPLPCLEWSIMIQLKTLSPQELSPLYPDLFHRLLFSHSLHSSLCSS